VDCAALFTIDAISDDESIYIDTSSSLPVELTILADALSPNDSSSSTGGSETVFPLRPITAIANIIKTIRTLVPNWRSLEAHLFHRGLEVRRAGSSSGRVTLQPEPTIVKGDFVDSPLSSKMKKWMVAMDFAVAHPELVVNVSENGCSGTPINILGFGQSLQVTSTPILDW
jgi:hypothetical protein